MSKSGRQFGIVVKHTYMKQLWIKSNHKRKVSPTEWNTESTDYQSKDEVEKLEHLVRENDNHNRWIEHIKTMDYPEKNKSIIVIERE